MVTMRLHRSGVILVIVFALLLAVLIFAAGYLTGMTRGMKIALQTPAVPKVAVPKVAVPKVPAIALPGSKDKAAPPTTSAAAAAPAATATQPAEMLTIRVGVFPSEEDAKALVQQLALGKVEATIAPLATDAGPTLYLVLAGRYTSRREAAEAAAELERKQGVGTAVMPLP